MSARMEVGKITRQVLPIFAHSLAIKRVFFVLLILSGASIFKLGLFSNYDSVANRNYESPEKHGQLSLRHGAAFQSLIDRNNRAKSKFDYSVLYSSYLNKCRTSNLMVWKGTNASQVESDELFRLSQNDYIDDFKFNQLQPSIQSSDLTKAVLVYFPISNSANFKSELKWLVRSWHEMRKYEPERWKTDLIVFIKDFRRLSNRTVANELAIFFTKLNCSFAYKRTANSDNSMCILLEYEPVKTRMVSNRRPKKRPSKAFDYEFFLNGSFHVFEPKLDDLAAFYTILSHDIGNYKYLDSVLIAFDGYEYLKDRYDFVIRSDLDVFLTPMLARWQARYCNNFYVGRGAYSQSFNMNRLRRIAFNVGFSYKYIENLGSTWYSNPSNFRLVAYLTLMSMVYISNEEFSPVERQGKLGVELWPYWHYGVLLLYGQNLAMNHLISSNTIRIIKLEDLLDVPSFSNKSDVFNVLHIHVYHNQLMFSKFLFKSGAYNNMTSELANLPDSQKNLVNYYSLKMALESQNQY